MEDNKENKEKIDEIATNHFKEHALPTDHTLLPFTYLNSLSRGCWGQKGLVRKNSSFASRFSLDGSD